MKKYKNFMIQLQDLQKIEGTCIRYTEWSRTELEADMWVAVRKKINNLIKYYETDK